MTICNTCAAGCCRRYEVSITGYDILKISRTLGIPPLFFLDISELTDNDYEQGLAKSEALFVFTNNNLKRSYRIKLKKTESTLIKDTVKCMFLQEWPGTSPKHPIVARCGIYNTRPLICATYPAKFVNNNRTVVVPYVYEREQDKKGTPYEICKQAFTDSDLPADKDELLNLLIKFHYETEYFQDIAEKWNKNPASINDFINELNDIYDKRVYIETGQNVIPYIA